MKIEQDAPIAHTAAEGSLCATKGFDISGERARVHFVKGIVDPFKIWRGNTPQILLGELVEQI